MNKSIYFSCRGTRYTYGTLNNIYNAAPSAYPGCEQSEVLKLSTSIVMCLVDICI